MKNLICTVCPNSCPIYLDSKTKEIKGNNCLRGRKFFFNETSSPSRIVTTTVKIFGGNKERISVKTSKEISKDLVFDCMHEIKKAYAKAPVKIGDIIIKNVLNAGVNIIATSDVSRKVGLLSSTKN